VGPKGAVVSFRNNVFADPSALIAWIQSMGPQARIRPDQKVVISRSWEDSDARLRGAEALARQIARMAVREQDVA
jgi:transcription-repair coupling factor (superfamily II helicase)